ncbi:hypothetical protein KR032_003222 [Drosophila birchii]|nr:hypothetical protein KR032_003222 [Drosophila birchii]
MAELKMETEDLFLESSCTQELNKMFRQMTLKLNLFRKNLNKMMNLMRSERNPFLRPDALSQVLKDMPVPSIDFEASCGIPNTNAPLKPTDFEMRIASSIAFKRSMVPISVKGLFGKPKWTPVLTRAKAVDTSTKMIPNAKDLSLEGGPTPYRQAMIAPNDMNSNVKNFSSKGEPPRTYRQAMVPIPVSVFLGTPDLSSSMAKKDLKLITASRSMSNPNITSMKW